MAKSKVQRETDAAEALLRKDLGVAYDTVIYRADYVVSQFGGRELGEELGRSGWGRSPHMILMLARIYDSMGLGR